MAKMTLQLWDRGAIGGWHAAVVIEGIRHSVPPKVVGDGHGAAIAVAFDSRADAERHALIMPAAFYGDRLRAVQSPP